ncbi:APC family permease [Phototrophicus methaneseepsis]|uniref:APC family permease n=1 Tax=Phototrophicus methaneseepsis TaxID=2710758 RepID=A0A7S8ECW0_9CHLR|nr:APC family permease [Phototrophicus methaneseepsis]QPC84609.1 APC family permease [Phototrophicus methaneseepsis]
MTDFKRVLIGQPFRTSQEAHERLDKVRALAVFASDPISSNAYATEAIMSVLIVLGSSALHLTLPLAMGVAALVLMVIFSYIQTIMHYPDGGGAYTVAKDNLGRLPSLLAAGALLTDYVLTVSVSVAAGVRAVTSAIPEIYDYRVIIALLAIALITWINLRGVRESGTIFAFPTYSFVAGVLLTIVIGLVRYFGILGAPALPVFHDAVPAEETLTGFAYIWLLLRAFAGGCTALTGIEAISNGVQAFKAPESKNAVKTMVAMGVIAMSLFVGITFLATHMHLVPTEEGESILSQMTRQISGGGILYFWVQLFTALILFLAANTGYQDFPRLSSFLAKDGFLPRWMQNRGDRLVYSSGILVLAAISSIIVIIFQASEIAMLPLYALGVMLSFTLSQAGMSHLMRRISKLKPGEVDHTGVTTIHHEDGWRWKMVVNTVGAITTGIVFLILLATKFVDGAWIVAVAIPLLVLMFYKIHKHYEHVAQSLTTENFEEEDLAQIANIAIVPIADVHRGTLRALQYAARIADDVRAACVATTPEVHARVEKRWMRFPSLTKDITLVMIDYDFRDILSPLAAYIEKVKRDEFPDSLITVVIPEFVPESQLAQGLHNKTADLLRRKLHSKQDIIIIDVPYHILADAEPEEADISLDNLEAEITEVKVEELLEPSDPIQTTN